MNKAIINFLKFLLFLSVGLGILYLVYVKQNAAYLEQCKLDGTPLADCSLIDKIIQDFKSANYFWVFIVLGCFTISNISRALRWIMLIKPLGYRPKVSNTLMSIFMNYFANLGLPRLGEVIRLGTMVKYEKIPLEKLTGTYVVDRTLDVLSLLLLIGLCFILEYQNLWDYLNTNANLGNLQNIFSNPFFYIFIALILLVLIVGWVKRAALLKTAIAQKLLNILKGFWEGILTIGKLDNPLLFIFHSINIWVMYYLMTYLCFFAFVPTAHLSPVVGLMVFVFGAFGIVIPSPGGMGTYHWLVIAALSIYGINSSDAFSFANIAFFSIQIGCNVLLGILSLVLLPLLNKNYSPPPYVEPI